ncbi:hypothetical protein CLIB1423_26S00100 [[Candida] railenensis]|uniref:Uncharacterized protein n=1 Tax=[Candida] railenensis TaxID=45579 RepID=A0A9P0QTK4_9ASCO|nr:hypothetical protein CLIB1423_26S00100 [[Candida] railenensis]
MTGLKVYSKKWKKGLKKFNSKLINEIHEELQQSAELHSDYQYLIDTGYFHSVLWDNLGTAPSKEHVELIVRLAVYDSTVNDSLNSCNLLEKDILSSKEQFEVLICTILDSITEISKTDSSSYVYYESCFDFLSLLITEHLSNKLIENYSKKMFTISSWKYLKNVDELLSTMPETVQELYTKEVGKKSKEENEKVKDNWAYNLLNWYSVSGKNHPHLKTSIEKFLVVCLSSVSIRFSLRTLVKEIMVPEEDSVLRYITYYPIDEFSYKMKSLEQLETDQLEKFYRLQKTVSASDSSDVLKWFTLLPSIYNLEEADKSAREVLSEFLYNIKDERLLLELAASMNVCQHRKDPFDIPCIIKSILNDLFPPNFDLKSSVADNLDQFDKKDIPGNSEIEEVISGRSANFLSLHHFIQSTFLAYSQSYRKGSFKSTLEILDRLSISKSGEIKGSSKYSSPIKTIELGLDGISSVFLEKDISFTVGNFILLVEILKPNPYGTGELMKKYGVSSSQICIVRSIKNKTCVVVKPNGFPVNLTHYNTIIKLPEDFNGIRLLLEKPNVITSLQLPSLIEDLITKNEFKHAKKLKEFKLDLPNSYQLLKKEFKEIEFEMNGQDRKRMKIEARTVSQNSGPLMVNVDNTGVNIKELDISPGTSIEGELSFECLYSSFSSGLTIIKTLPFSNETFTKSLLSNLLLNFPNEKILVVVPDYASDFKIERGARSIFLSGNLSFDLKQLDNKVKELNSLQATLFAKVDSLSNELRLDNLNFSQSYEDSVILLKRHIEPQWLKFLSKVKITPSNETLQSEYFFRQDIDKSLSFEANLKKIMLSYIEVLSIFEQLKLLNPLRKLDNQSTRHSYIVNTYCNVVQARYQFFRKELQSSELLSLSKKLRFGSVLLTEVHLKTAFESLIPFYFIKSVKRVIVMGNEFVNRESLVSKYKTRTLGPIGPEMHVRSEISSLYHSEAKYLDELPVFNGGFDKCVQIVESKPDAHPRVNIDEAEYIVAIYQYMRALGYKSNSIGILCHSPFQQHLINEVLNKKCVATNCSTGLPHYVNTELGEPLDYILVSMHGCANVLFELKRASTISRLGLYALSAGDNIPKGFQKSSKLRIRIGEDHASTKRSKQTFQVEDSAHMVDYVSQLLKK